MKKRLFTRLTCLTLTAAIVLSFSGFIYADETEGVDIPQNLKSEESDVVEKVVIDVDFDNDELAENFIMKKMSGITEPTNVKFNFINQLSGYEKTIYENIVPAVVEIAEGKRQSTEITIPQDQLYMIYSNEDMGVSDFSVLTPQQRRTLLSNKLLKEFDYNIILSAMLFSCPYDLYWYDKTVYPGLNFTVRYSKSQLIATNITLIFYVANEYQGESNTEVNPLYAESANAAANNAKNIIIQNSSKNDYDKLLAYNNAICELTSYNNDALENNPPYGNPWQLVWAFDGDPKTEVVCEGYAKAFQYLCDNSVFRSDEVYAISVSGNMGGGGHMWNIVHMDDGKNYLVDVTNSDNNTHITHDYTLLFMVGATGSVASGYSKSEYGIIYTYKDHTKTYYGEAPLTLESSSYDPKHKYYITVNCGAGGTATADGDDNYVYAGDKINVYTYPNTGYKVDKISVNGKPITGDWFYMPGRNVEINVTFKQIDYDITVNTGEGGTVECPASAHYGDKINLNVTPATGYKLDKITSDQVNISNNSFTMPAKNVSLNATFKKIDYKIKANYGEGGYITVPATANYKDNVTITTKPSLGYTVDKIKVNGKEITGNTFVMPAGDVTVDATFKKIVYTITVDPCVGGTVEAPLTATYGEKINLTITPETGYEIKEIKVNNTVVENDYFYMPTVNVTIYATFVKIDYSVSIIAPVNGNVKVSATTANYKDKITVTATPDTGYTVDKIKVNGTEINGNTFEMPAADATVSVTFKKIDYTITVNAGDGGTVNCPKTAQYGDKVTISALPAAGYMIDKITSSDVTINNNSFTMPAKGVNISVTFKKIDYKITVNAGEGGTVNCQKTAQYGDKVTLTVTPNAGYTLDKITSDQVNVSNNSFTMPAGEVKLNVTFKKIDYTITVNSGEGGTATASATGGNVGDKITVNCTPEAGYKLDQIKVNGTAINDTTFDMPAANVTVTVTFKKIDYKITVNTGEGGTANCQKTAQVGDKVTLTVAPDVGYTLDKITSEQVNVSNNSFTMPAGEVKLNVTFKKIDYTITVNSGEGGTATASATGGNVGDKITVDCAPETGYKVDQIKVNNTAINGNTFDMPAANVTVTVTFKKIDYTITVNSGENGSATAPASGNYNDKITVTCTPAKGYEVDSITVNGTEIEGNTFTMPAEVATVEVTFRKALYELSISNTAGGSATLSATSAYYGDEITVDVSADDGYHLAAIKVNGKAIEGNKFAMPDGKTAVEVVFEKNEYKITASAATGGKVTLSASAASAGTVITVKATADKGYELDKITYTPDGGKAVDITSAAKFTMPAKDVTVKVTFKKTVVKVTLTLDKTSAKIVCGSTQTLKATLKNSSSKVAWKSSNSKIASVDSNGKITAKQAGKVTITASAAGVSAACTVQVLFKDVVNEKDFWFTPTYYLVNKGVVKGYDNQTLFKPTNDCSRAQMITFLWRLQGEPAPKSSTNKFKDVKSSDYFYKASIWAVEQGITTVPSDKKFNPQGICTRAQTVTFLWRMAGKPEPKKGINKFSDIRSADYFYKATLWANELKIVSGYDDGTFRPLGNCTRRQMVTFLYKYDKYVNGKG